MGSRVFKDAVSTVVRNKVTRQCPTTQLLRITSCIKTIKTDHLAPHLLHCCQRTPWTVGVLVVFWWILRSNVRCWHNVFRPSMTCSNSTPPPPPPPPIFFSRTCLIILHASLCASCHIKSSLSHIFTVLSWYNRHDWASNTNIFTLLFSLLVNNCKWTRFYFQHHSTEHKGLRKRDKQRQDSSEVLNSSFDLCFWVTAFVLQQFSPSLLIRLSPSSVANDLSWTDLFLTHPTPIFSQLCSLISVLVAPAPRPLRMTKTLHNLFMINEGAARRGAGMRRGG